MDYTNMSPYYDIIMTSGYYNYKKIVDELMYYYPLNRVLEIGCGTGLILEELIKRKPIDSIMGVDLTESMLSIARERLQPFSEVSLSLQNILNLTLPNLYDLAFSYGGVWYFVIDKNKEPILISHISDDDDNHRGFSQVYKCLSKTGKLLLGIQNPHQNYETTINNGMVYSQKITPCKNGFIKDYYLRDATKVIMHQTTHYRTYSFAEAKKLLADNGFNYEINHHNKLFMEFSKQ